MNLPYIGMSTTHIYFPISKLHFGGISHSRVTALIFHLFVLVPYWLLHFPTALKYLNMQKKSPAVTYSFHTQNIFILAHFEWWRSFANGTIFCSGFTGRGLLYCNTSINLFLWWGNTVWFSYICSVKCVKLYLTCLL